MDVIQINQFSVSFEALQEEIFTDMADQGFHDNDLTPDLATVTGDLASVALICSEAGELVEALRKPGVSDHDGLCMTKELEELADIVIRCMDYAGRKNLDLAGGILEKVKYNRSRPYRHGDKLA